MGRILNAVECATFLGVSARTLDRLDVPKVQISGRRVGYPAGLLEEWLQLRLHLPAEMRAA